MNNDLNMNRIDDTISRQAAIEAIGEKPVAWSKGEYERGLQNQWGYDVSAIKKLPSAQPEPLQPWEVLAAQAVLSQPEIIRCKDCKFWTNIKRTNRYWCKTDDGLYDLNPSPNDFCSRAERRIDERTD